MRGGENEKGRQSEAASPFPISVVNLRQQIPTTITGSARVRDRYKYLSYAFT